MRPRSHSTAAQSALLSLLGSLIASCAFLPIVYRHRQQSFTLTLLISFAVLIAGFVVSLRSNSNLKNGIANQLWSDEQVQSLRAWIDSPFYTAATIALLLVYVLLIFVSTQFKYLGWIAFLFSQNLSQLRFAIQRPRPKSGPPMSDWHSLAPLHSDHWGNR